MVNRKRKHQRKAYLSEKESNAVNLVTDITGSSNRELFLKGLRQDALKAEEALKRQHKAHDKAIREEIRNNMLRAISDFEEESKAKKLTCKRCGETFINRQEGPRQVPCWRCGYKVKVPVPEMSVVQLHQAQVPNEGGF